MRIGGGIAAALFAYLISHSIALSAIMGMTVPVMREKYGKDPAVGFSVLLTFATDTMGFLIFFGLATLFLL